MIDVQTKLTNSFTLYEFLRSETAERQPDLLAAQMNPPDDVVSCLTYLAQKTLQPLRDRFNYPLHISSGYRSPELNNAVGGVPTSQHCFGQAADLILPDAFLTDPATASIRQEIQEGVQKITGSPLRSSVNANFYLFAYVCLHLEDLDIDQVIHEYGTGYGRPAWTHVAASGEQHKREIVVLGKYAPANQHKPNLKTALAFGI